MIYLEMSRDEVHGGGSWAFGRCLWAPTKKRNGVRASSYWSKILEVCSGDTVLHLRGRPPEAYFVGYSTVVSNGYETASRPPEPGEWNYARSFYRADLNHFTQFNAPVKLAEAFISRRAPLEAYFDKNKRQVARDKLDLFFVRQGGRLQCQNGAYLSVVDGQLFEALFETRPTDEKALAISVATGEQLAIVKSRIGQSLFSRELKDLYKHRCCFPTCSVDDTRFLVASHIARWSDNESLRGHFGNGLCLCLIHDKAFEIGLFTLNDRFEIVIKPSLLEREEGFTAELRMASGKRIRLSTVHPLKEALVEHRNRTGLLCSPVGAEQT